MSEEKITIDVETDTDEPTPNRIKTAVKRVVTNRKLTHAGAFLVGAIAGVAATTVVLPMAESRLMEEAKTIGGNSTEG